MEFFISDSGDERRIHPHARKLINNWIATIAQNIPQLVELDKDQIAKDAATYLSDDEKITYTHYLANISGYLSQCTDIQDNTLYPTLISLNKAMGKLLPLLLMVYRRKADKAEADRRKTEAEQREREEQAKKKAEAERKKREDEKREREALREAQQRELEEQQRKQEAERIAQQEKEEAVRKEQAEKAERERREKEKEERWHAAYRAVHPPLDAWIYLNQPGEQEKFKKAIRKAVLVYLEKGAEYLDDTRIFDYRWLLDTINRRKGEEIRKVNQRKEEKRRETTAQSQAQEYNKRLNSEIAGLKQSLCHNEKDHSGYFQEQVNDARYVGYSFNHILTDEDRQAFDKTLISIATRELDKLVAKDFRQFIDSECWRTYFLLPSVDYSSNGVPCLDFTFDVFAVVETRVWLKSGQKSFSGYTFQFPWRGEKGHSILVQEPEFLGYHYHILTPSDLSGYVFWQSVPLVLLKGLLNGETKPAGTTISVASDGNITYRIPKFKEDVAIPDSFAWYMKKIGTIDGMLSMGIISKKVAGIIESELCQLQPEQKPLALERRVNGRDTKKAAALQLYRQGKGPSSPEVLALGMHKSTRFKYYNMYLTSQ